MYPNSRSVATAYPNCSLCIVCLLAHNAGEFSLVGESH